jgi:cellulose 1,4-beta-cellobiosidase
VNFDGVEAFDSITDQFCTDTKDLFGDLNDHEIKGGLRQMGNAMKNGMVLALSLWDDHAAYMLWLDSTYPVDAAPGTPGAERGPCPTSSGRPEDVEAQQPNAAVKFGNIKYGDIGSTYARKA